MHLEWSRSRLFEQRIDAHWVEFLAVRPELAERLEAFVSRYGRLQDTLADSYCRMLIETYDRLRQDAVTRLGIPPRLLPAEQLD